MKKSVLVMLVALLVSCSDKQVMEIIADVKESGLVNDKVGANPEIEVLINKARWGDGQAFIQLADCYRDGVGVEKDIIGMLIMVEQARVHGAIKNNDAYIMQIPDDKDIRRYYDLIMSKSKSELREEKDSLIAQLEAMDDPDALAFKGFVCIINEDSINGYETIRKAADKGSNVAALLEGLFDNTGTFRPDKTKLEQIAERIPLAYKILGKLYFKPDENGNIDEEKVAYYFMKSEEHALLSRKEAQWLLDNYKEGGVVQLSDEDVMRLETFIHIPGEGNVAATDTLSIDNKKQDNQ